MANIDEQRELVVNSPIRNPNEEGGASFRNNNNNSSGSREEGELSASDNDVNPSHFHLLENTAHFARSMFKFTICYLSFLLAGLPEATSLPPKVGDQNVCSADRLTSSDATPLEQQVHIVTVNENSQDAQTEKCTSSKMGYSIDVPYRAPQESAHLKSSKKNREHFVPFLISFSDDSGSDCENSGQKKISASKNRTLAADKCIKPPAPAPRRPQKLQNITRNAAKLMPSKGAISHKVSSLLTKTNGGSYGNAGHLHSLRNFNNLNKVATLDHGKRASVHLNSSKLHDLRQLIAIRENELNLEKLQNAKKLTSASGRDTNVVNKRNLAARASRETNYDNLEELKEPDKKRQKMVPNPSWGFSNSQEITSMVIGSEKCALKDSDQLERADHSSHGEKYPSCSVIAGQLKQKEYQGSSSSTNPSLTLKDGINAVRNHNQSSSNSSKEVASKSANKLDKAKHATELCSQYNQPLLQKKVNSGPAGVNVTEKSDSNLVRSKENAQKPAPDGNIIAASIHGADSNAGANVTSLNFPSFWNCYDKLKISGSSSIDLQPLLNLEELQDKELEEAQEYRCKCEIEERNALKSYRKAQRALLEANARCSQLYSRREQYSAQLRDLMMGNPNLLLSSGSPDETGIGLDTLPAISDVNLHLIPTSSCAVQPKVDFNNQHRSNLNVHPNNVALQSVSSVQEHYNLASDPCSEPDCITVKPHTEDNDANDMCSPSEDFNMSQNEDEGMFLFEDKSPENHLDYQRKEKSRVDMDKNTNNASEGQSAMDRSQDSLLLEASLRSQLFERLRMRTLCQKASPQESLEAVAEGRAENNELVGRVVIDDRLCSDSERENGPQQGSDLQGSVPLYCYLTQKQIPFSPKPMVCRKQFLCPTKVKARVDPTLPRSTCGISLRMLLTPGRTSLGIMSNAFCSYMNIMIILCTTTTYPVKSHNVGSGEGREYADLTSTLLGHDMMSTIFKMPAEVDHQCNNEKFGSNFASPSSYICLDSCINTGDDKSQFASLVTFSYPILKSAILDLKVSDSMDLLKLQIRNSIIQTSHDQGEDNFGSSAIPSISSSVSAEAASVDLIGSKSGSYSCDVAIDPLWPLCIFELRGKCNNPECSAQHVRDYSSDKVGSPTQGQISSAKRTLTKSLDCLGLAPPTYLVGLDVLKADLQSCKSILSHEYSQLWVKCFSLSFVLSSQLPTDLPFDEPLFHGANARVEMNSCCPSLAHAVNAVTYLLITYQGLCKELSADDDQIVEMALLNLSQEANKSKGRLQALKLLARALEANPTSAVVWIVYLLLYYSSQKSIGKDDMFKCAVEHTEGSYELWLLYINSRTQLDERLTAYDAALLALCRHASASDRNALFASDGILDIFLQMMNCLCMSGNVATAIDKINELHSTEEKSDSPLRPSLPDIITCLTISDKCIFWVCCVYLVVYRRLPITVLQRFEYQKELSSIEWPSADLTFDEKQRGVSLMELAVDSLALYIDRESLEDEANLRAAHLFSVNHVRCVVVLKGLECSRSLLENYVTLYPSCLELVLMLARAEHDFADGSFEGFEDALDNWFDEVPGVQCIWNQYIQCALQNRKRDFVEGLMARWFQYSWKHRYSQNSCLDTVDSDNSQSLPQSASVSDIAALFSNSRQNDIVFGMLNCSIYKLLQNDYTEAQLAIDRALEVASTENYSHCVREHLLFLSADSLHKDGQALRLLSGYLADKRASNTSEPLSRQFIQRIKKPRVRQLVGKLLCSVSLESSVMNTVLEAWYGLSLLPEKKDELTNFVDMVEGLMEILPSNYHLAICVCKQLTRTSCAANASDGVSFWGSALLISALFRAVPVAPEYVWVEAAEILHDLTGCRSLSVNFLKRALSIYPFSIMLWKSYLNLSEAEGNSESVREAAMAKGIELQ
ncbi:hypothetical protein RND71_010913 [Anisodus tanguticus]|uniref:Putative zinc-finger domain-containing protein n=1 Tax=Anisodus tanguticus TaxID=243964 RepID=A0AAE1VIJ0_9SOLA|nr:hypothetical protein RND71_010913 [Anisodus tanguticus]